MTKTLDKRPEVGLNSFDRFFPNQYTMPRGGLGNLIALPLQKAARDKNHSVFVDDNFNPYPDQWAFLASVKKIKWGVVEQYVNDASRFKELLPASFNTDDSSEAPWERSTSNRYPVIDAVLPKRVSVTLSNQIFVDTTGIPAKLRNRIGRLASFSNPEFYQAQAIEDGQNSIILATGRYLREGFDLPALDTLFLTFPISWEGTLAQYAGRLHREHHGKTEVRIYDYVDTSIPVLQRMHEKRMKGYYSLGYNVSTEQG